MSGVNADNERIKRRYFHYLREADGRSPKTINIARLALAKWDRFTGSKDYCRFKSADAIAFKKKLLEGGGRRSAELSSRSTVHSTLLQVQKFFRWLVGQPGFKKAISYADVEYFSLSARDRQIALHRRAKPSPSIEQVQHVIRSMSAETDIQLRDRALVACALLTGARVSALISLKLKHVRADRLGIDQDAVEVETKFGKSFETFFFRVGDDIEQIFLNYVDHLTHELKFGPDDPLFPSTRLVVRAGHKFESEGLNRAHWKTPDAVRRIFRRAFAAAGVPYYTPHTLRRTLALVAQQRCSTAEDLKAWSQNLGHNNVLTTLLNYGAIPPTRQAELVRSKCKPASTAAPDLANIVRELIRQESAALEKEPSE